MKLIDMISKAVEDKAMLGTFVDPFSAEHVKRVFIVLRKDFKGTNIAQGTVYFENGDTKGEHEISCASLDLLLPKLKAFIEGLETKA